MDGRRTRRRRRRAAAGGRCAQAAPFRVAGGFLSDAATARYVPARYGYVTGLGIRAVYPKLHHATTPNAQAIRDFDAGWAGAWHAAGCYVVGWGWLADDPVREAELAVALCRKYDLDGYIANAETAYEGVNAWKSRAFVERFRELAPRAPLALSFIGLGVPYRDLDWRPWLDAGASFMPQLYWGDSAIGLAGPLRCADAVPIPRASIKPTLGTSGFAHPYAASTYASELVDAGLTDGWSVWLLESTTDDYLRALAPAL